MRRHLGAAALSFGLLGALFPGGSSAADATREEMRGDLLRLVAAGEEMLDAQSDFNAARAAGDRDEMKDAAFDLAWGAAVAVFNAVMLDLAVTPGNASPEADRQAAELRALADEVFQTLVPIILDGDFEALGARLDESGDTLTRFFQLTRGISAQPGLRSFF